MLAAGALTRRLDQRLPRTLAFDDQATAQSHQQHRRKHTQADAHPMATHKLGAAIQGAVGTRAHGFMRQVALQVLGERGR